MKRAVLLVALVGIVAMPFGRASANDHCDTPIVLFSGTGLLLNTKLYGCDVVGADEPETPWDDSDTNWITPGAAEGQVRWDQATRPVDGRVEDGAVLGSRFEFNGSVTALRFQQGDDVAGMPGPFWDSQALPIGRSASLTQAAHIVVCLDAAFTQCETADYRPVGPPQL